MMLPVLSELSELYRAADGAATACLLAKLGVEKSLMAKLDDTRQALLVRQGAGWAVPGCASPLAGVGPAACWVLRTPAAALLLTVRTGWYLGLCLAWRAAGLLRAC